MASTTSAARQPSATAGGAPLAKPKPTPSPSPSPTPTPTPTPNSDNRTVYFGWPETGGDRQLQPSVVTTGNVLSFEVIARNDDNQNLTHPVLAFGDLAESGGPDANGLPNGATLLDVEFIDGVECESEVLSASGYKCELPNFTPDDFITVRFIIQTGTNAINNDILWASFKVAEKVSNVGANQNTAYASAALTIAPTSSNANSTYKTGGEFSLSTGGQTLVKKDSMTTTVGVPNDSGVGAISISEEDCDNSCVGQIATVHVREGAAQTPYLEWRLVIIGNIEGVITHTLDEVDEFGNPIEVEISEPCVDIGTDFDVDCIFSNEKNGNATTIGFRTGTNGKVRAN